jgi:hypothetical protein
MRRKVKGTRRRRPSVVVLWRVQCLIRQALEFCTWMMNAAMLYKMPTSYRLWSSMREAIEQREVVWQHRLDVRARKALPSHRGACE